MNKPRETPLTECEHDKRFRGVLLMPKETHGCVACGFELSLRTATELGRYVIHNSACKKRIGLYTVIPCDCGLDAILARLSGGEASGPD